VSIRNLPQMAVVAVAQALPSVWGAKICTGMSASAFRKGVLWLLVFAGLVMLVAAFRGGIR
jgi:uncharacterized membrane protein YfcA